MVGLLACGMNAIAFMLAATFRVQLKVVNMKGEDEEYATVIKLFAHFSAVY